MHSSSQREAGTETWQLGHKDLIANGFATCLARRQLSGAVGVSAGNILSSAKVAKVARELAPGSFIDAKWD